MRSLDDSLEGPEYAINLLIAELSTDTLPDPVQEVSIRIYSTRYQLLGADVWQKPNGRKAPRKIRFQLASSSYWLEDCCHLFLYCNGLLRGYASFALFSDYDKWENIALEEAADHPEALFFVGHLCHQPWWSRLAQGSISPTAIRNLIDSLLWYTSAPSPKRHWVVSGDEAQAAAFATSILAASLTDSHPKACCRFALNDLLSGRLSWSLLRDNLDDKKTVVVQVDRMGTSTCNENMLDLLSDWLKSADALPFVFHGSEKNIDLLLQYIPALADLFDEHTTFALSEMPDNSIWNDDEETELPLPEEAGVCDLRQPCPETTDTSCNATQKLERLIGLSQLKADMQDACLAARFARERRELGLDPHEENRHHMLFYGNPGTGKTTVARLVGELYHQMGVLSKGHTVETCRTDLVGEYIGHTENRMKEVLEQARGGVLFIDEAYTLVGRSKESNDFGKEVIHALLPILSEPDPDLIVILAGYEEKMQTLLQSNPGLKDRFPLKFYFEDYTNDELYAIACQTLQDRGFVLTPAAEQRLRAAIARATAHRDAHFGNGRWVHNLIEQGIVKSMARRIMSIPGHDRTDRVLLSTVEATDIDEAEARLALRPDLRVPQPVRVGFRA